MLNLNPQQEKDPLQMEIGAVKAGHFTGFVRPELKTPQLVLARVSVNSKKETSDILSSINDFINVPKIVCKRVKKIEEKSKEKKIGKKSKMKKTEVKSKVKKKEMKAESQRKKKDKDVKCFILKPSLKPPGEVLVPPIRLTRYPLGFNDDLKREEEGYRALKQPKKVKSWNLRLKKF